MYSYDRIYRSIIYFVSMFVPSGVYVVDGESYGIRLDDPAGKQPSIAVNIEQSSDISIELGSFATRFDVVLTISAKSRIQRDALKTIVHSGILSNVVPIYTSFTNNIPSSGAVIERYLEAADYFKLKDMPNLETDREKFFWNAVCFVTLDTFGY